MASLLTNNNNNNNDDESKGGDDDSNDLELLRERTDSQEIEIQATGKRGKITKKEGKLVMARITVKLILLIDRLLIYCKVVVLDEMLFALYLQC